MSSRTKAGIAIGVVVGALAATSAVLLPWIHRHRIDVPPQGKLAPSQEKAVPKKQDTRVYEKDGVARIPEIGEGLRHEADNDGEIYELELGEYLQGRFMQRTCARVCFYQAFLPGSGWQSIGRR